MERESDCYVKSGYTEQSDKTEKKLELDIILC